MKRFAARLALACFFVAPAAARADNLWIEKPASKAVVQMPSLAPLIKDVEPAVDRKSVV